MALAICLDCPHVQPPPHSGPCACTISGRDIAEHAQANICPKGYFGEIRGFGDLIRRITWHTRIDRLAERWNRHFGTSCKCSSRQHWLNALWQRIEHHRRTWCFRSDYFFSSYIDPKQSLSDGSA